MSLLNQMLQDLDQREALDRASVTVDASVRTVPARRRLFVGLVLLAVAAVAAAGLTAWWFTQGQRAPQPAREASSTPPQARATLPAEPAPPRVEASTAASPAIAAAPIEMPKTEVAPSVRQAQPNAGAAPAATAQAPPSAESQGKPSPTATADLIRVPKAESPPKDNQSKVADAIKPPKAMAPPEAPAKAAIQKTAPERNAVVAQADVATTNRATDKAIERKAPRAPIEGAPAFSKTMTAQQRSDNLLKEGIRQAQSGRNAQATETLRLALDANPDNPAARQVLITLMIERRDLVTASALLEEGLRRMPGNRAYAMTLARLQLDLAGLPQSLATLEQNLAAAGDDPEYQAFYALLLQRAGRHEEAVKHYLIALRSDPEMPAWLMGIGISLDAIDKPRDAVEAFRRAKDSGRLSAAQLRFVDQRLASAS
jgi:MSHA biogenesis protein MshN